MHGILDRFAAIDLLRWGINGQMPEDISHEKQLMLIKPLISILSFNGCRISNQDEEIHIYNDYHDKEIIIYPAMRKMPNDNSKIMLSDALCKYAKPMALKRIISEF